MWLFPPSRRRGVPPRSGICDGKFDILPDTVHHLTRTVGFNAILNANKQFCYGFETRSYGRRAMYTAWYQLNMARVMGPPTDLARMFIEEVPDQAFDIVLQFWCNDYLTNDIHLPRCAFQSSCSQADGRPTQFPKYHSCT
ncbi:hypothetical protein AVEN_28199-1 [Araneus ventricosus]|uniref:Uncharacterized protein n=1 Tax=Araneus ventricosus TaxID=182803 RepID=A0A4Y2EYW8_ARAVE|nr:hypothetical protein AVEN_28199-1 [Araneus ventricosus]